MKQIFFCILLILINNCDKSTKELTDNTNKKSEIISTKEANKQIDFLDTKYQKNGLSVPDDLNGELYPSYSYFDKSIGAFSVNYIGKDDNTRYYWNINNPKGYFSDSGSFSENSAINSSAIKKAINKSDYYTFVDYVSAKYIKNIEGNDDEFDIIDGAITSFYLYENFKWVKIGEIQTKKIPERTFQYYIDIINSHVNKTPENTSWNGVYNLFLDYGKLDEFSEMSIDYEIEINDTKCTFSGMGYKTDFTDLCEVEKKNEDTLILKYLKTVDSDGFTDHSNIEVLGILMKKNDSYFIKSPIIADLDWKYNVEIPIKKKLD